MTVKEMVRQFQKLMTAYRESERNTRAACIAVMAKFVDYEPEDLRALNTLSTQGLMDRASAALSDALFEEALNDDPTIAEDLLK